MISLPYLGENTAKICENEQKLASKTVRAANFRRLFKSPARESSPGNDGNLRAESDRAGIARILHPDTYSVFVVCLSTGV